MTNFQIISNEAINNNIYTKEEIESQIINYGQLLIKTFAEWQKVGYAVKRGEKAKIKCLIWRHKNMNKEEEDKEPNESDGYYKTTAYLFTFEQVQKVK